MTQPKRQKRLFNGMSYADVQRSNSNRRNKLPKSNQTQLKAQGYKNVGWDNIIQLHQKIDEILHGSDPNEETLEELFLKVERIGNKYQTPEEIADFNQKLAAEAQAIADEVDRQFPEPEMEFIDYSQANPRSRKSLKRQRR